MIELVTTVLNVSYCFSFSNVLVTVLICLQLTVRDWDILYLMKLSKNLADTSATESFDAR